MNDDSESLENLLQSDEGEHLEFKEAKTQFEFDELVRYCVALANERGGKLVLGVSDRRPRRIVGTQAFRDLAKLKHRLLQQLHMRIEIEDLAHPSGRVLVFNIPSRPPGLPIQFGGAYLMRSGESLTPMTPERLKAIFAETGPDFTAEICGQARVSDLASEAIEAFRRSWHVKTGNERLLRLPPEQLLRDAELVTEAGVTHAALILFGKQSALRRHLAQAEVIFEYRSGEASGPAQQRLNFQDGFFAFQSDLWEKIHAHNDLQSFRNGFFVRDIRTFNPIAIREALVNAVSHRDYRMAGSITVRQFPRRLEIVSPGGFLPGIDAENFLWRHNPRNRRIAETFERTGLAERSGQGLNLMFEECIKEGKPIPDFAGTDDFQVAVSLHGEIHDSRFLLFLEKIGAETMESFRTEDFLALDAVYREQRVAVSIRDRLPRLFELGVLEKVGRKYILSRRFYEFLGKKGAYTRKRGLDREMCKELLYNHIRDNGPEGTRLNELYLVLPDRTRQQIQRLLNELRENQRVHALGKTKGSRWYPGSGG